MDKATRAERPHTSIFCLRHGGTHLIKPLVKRLVKLPTVDLGKIPNPEKHVPLGPVVIGLRDPRNVIVAAVKWHLRRAGEPIEPGPQHDKALAHQMAQMMPYMVRYVSASIHRPGVVTRFEALVAPDGPAEAERVARELGCAEGDGAAALAAVLGTGHTFTGSYSDHRQWFGPRANSAWINSGGVRLLNLMGYQA